MTLTDSAVLKIMSNAIRQKDNTAIMLCKDLMAAREQLEQTSGSCDCCRPKCRVAGCRCKWKKTKIGIG